MNPPHPRILAASVAALLALGALLGGVPPAAAAQTYVEDFEDDTNGNEPSSPFYSWTSSATGTFRVTTEQAHAGTRAYKQVVSGSDGWYSTWNLSPKSINVCSSETVPAFRVAFRFDAWNPGTAAAPVLRLMNAAGNEYVLLEYLTLSGFPRLDLKVFTSAGSGANQPLITNGAAGTWYVFEARFTNCAAGKANIFLYQSDGTTELAFVSVDAPGSFAGTDRVQVGNRNGAAIYIDDVQFVNVNDAPTPTVGAAASALVTGLVGFDVDTTGTTVVARVASGGAIRTYDGGTLGTHLGEYLVPNCVRSDGVVAAESHVGFLDCAPNGGVDTYRIRYKDLTNAQFPATCLGCTQDFTGANDGGDPQASFGDMNEIGEISTYPLDGTNHERLFYVSQPFACGSPGPDQRCTVQRVAYTWSSVAQKRVGVHTYVFRQGDEDFLAEAYDTLSSPQQICNFYREGNWYVAGASGTGPATVWRVSFQQGRDDLTASLNKGLALPMSTSIACSTDKVAILDGTTLKVFDTFTGEVIPQLTRTVSAQSASRRLALSPDGKFGAIHDGSTIKIIDATTGSITGQVTTPAGSWRRMEFDATAQNLFTGTDTRIDRFKVVSLTTVTDKSTFVDPTELSPAAGGSITEVATQNPLAVGTGLISGMIPGAGNRWVEYVLGVLTAIGFAGIAWKATGGTVGRFGSRPGDSNVIGTAGFLGLCLSVPAYDFPLWIPLLTGVAGVALITRRFFR